MGGVDRGGEAKLRPWGVDSDAGGEESGEGVVSVGEGEGRRSGGVERTRGDVERAVGEREWGMGREGEGEGVEREGMWDSRLRGSGEGVLRWISLSTLSPSQKSLSFMHFPARDGE